MAREQELIAPMSATTPTLMRDGDYCRDQQRLVDLEHENSCLKRAMSELMIEKLLLQSALEARYSPAAQPSGSEDALIALASGQRAPQRDDQHLKIDYADSQDHRNAGPRGPRESVLVAPQVLSKQLCAAYDALLSGPMPDEIMELVQQLEKEQRTSRQSFIGQFLSMRKS